MEEKEYYIAKLEEKLPSIKDKELLDLIQKLLEERNYLSQIANIDTLTGLNNRRVLERIRDFDSVLICDIDNFKTINDSYGHSIGDKAIKGVAQVIKKSIRSADYVCRFGGDEFVVIFCNCPEDVVKKRADFIREKVKRMLRINSNPITLSIGIAKRQNLESVEETIKKADKALYEAKREGKDRVREFELVPKEEYNRNR